MYLIRGRRLVRGIARHDKVANQINLSLSGDGVAFGEFVPGNAEIGGFEKIDLFPSPGKGDNWIIVSVSDEETLLMRDGRKLFDEFFRLAHIAADADQPGEAVRVAKPDINRHQAALRKAEEHGLFGWKTFGALNVEQFKEQFAAAFYSV